MDDEAPTITRATTRAPALCLVFNRGWHLSPEINDHKRVPTRGEMNQGSSREKAVLGQTVKN